MVCKSTKVALVIFNLWSAYVGPPRPCQHAHAQLQGGPASMKRKQTRAATRPRLLLLPSTRTANNRSVLMDQCKTHQNWGERTTSAAEVTSVDSHVYFFCAVERVLSVLVDGATVVYMVKWSVLMVISVLMDGVAGR